ncbi:uncharacterized protein DUF2793 [Blastomonas natatoria]|uniref:Uncharacterized protein DUF2793 n=1 Tax=Blastomonas natatoria TaxID=34015 RepID=A0A2V3V8P0_9SPHN|nr:DUF2793 domain-containing protein [Blastomonas natatoria]PXW78146.1 uncharacterized protein DUF2793 [Blastomonas natatoria]
MSHTPNFSMPLLHAAQSQKEITHNEALIIIDALLVGSVMAVAGDPSMLTPANGEAWIIDESATGAWTGRASQIAIFSEGGWRFARPVAGMRMLDRAAGLLRTFDGTQWLAPASVDSPSGGTIVDLEARSSLVALLTALRHAGLLAVT